MRSGLDSLKGSRNSLAVDLIEALDPREYLRRLEYDPYPWQVFTLERIRDGATRLLLLGARQGGRSTVTAGIPAYISKNEKALSLIYAPGYEQGIDDIERVKEFIYRDDSYPPLVLDAMEHVKLPNGSFIKANTSTAKTKRGKSKPRVIIFEEAAWIEDVLYKTVRPMLVMNPSCIVVGLTTPNGRKGWFHKAWAESTRWVKIMVKAPWEIEAGELVPAEPEKQFQKRMLARGIHAFYSPRHTDRDFMVEELEEHGETWFRQEYLCEFVEPEDQVFSYDQIDKIFTGREVKPVEFGLVKERDVAALEVRP